MNWANADISMLGAFRTGLHSSYRTMRHVSGFDYAIQSTQHYARRAAAGFGRGAYATGGASAAKSVLKTTAWAGLLGPGIILGAAAMSPHGMAVGVAEETAGFIAGGATFAPLLAAGKGVGRFTGGYLGEAIAKRVPSLITKTAGMNLGRLVGAGVGTAAGFIGGFVAWEAARWTVGFALHTLPVFSRQFQADMTKEGFGGDYTDTAGAATMRARSLQVMGKSFANARSALGQEAALMHV